jgi:hypothetical protein
MAAFAFISYFNRLQIAIETSTVKTVEIAIRRQASDFRLRWFRFCVWLFFFCLLPEKWPLHLILS